MIVRNKYQQNSLYFFHHKSLREIQRSQQILSQSHSLLYCIYIIAMSSDLAPKSTQKFPLIASGLSGALASFLTQPLEVIKTNRINSPSLLYSDLHRLIMQRGWKYYMRGSSLAVVRQAFGFTIYTQLLQYQQKFLIKQFPNLNKYANYSISSVFAKLLAMIFQSPLTLLKTRAQKLSTLTIKDEINVILSSPLQQLTKGLGSTIARQTLYTLFHYTTFRYLKDSLFLDTFNINNTFMPAFIAGIVSITVSQPLEVIRNQVSLNNLKEPLISYLSKYSKEYGLRGYFFGFLPRLVRKPINSGISWSIYQYLIRQ